eukprot:363758-Chlamydomonas_euryale.AAC.8
MNSPPSSAVRSSRCSFLLGPASPAEPGREITPRSCARPSRGALFPLQRSTAAAAIGTEQGCQRCNGLPADRIPADPIDDLLHELKAASRCNAAHKARLSVPGGRSTAAAVASAAALNQELAGDSGVPRPLPVHAGRHQRMQHSPTTKHTTTS